MGMLWCQGELVFCHTAPVQTVHVGVKLPGEEKITLLLLDVE